MAIDNSNLLRVDLNDVYDLIENISAHRSQALDEGQTVDIMAVVEDDRIKIYPFIILATAEIADRSNYIQNVHQNGLEALTRSTDGDFVDQEIDMVPEKHKLMGESLSPNPLDTLVFAVPELENFTPNKYTIIQEYIKEAIVRFALYKWYAMLNASQFASEEYQFFERAVSQLRFNSITNRKRKSVKLPLRYF